MSSVHKNEFVERVETGRLDSRRLAESSEVRQAVEAVPQDPAGNPRLIDTTAEWTALFVSLAAGQAELELTDAAMDDLAEIEDAAQLDDETWRRAIDPRFVRSPPRRLRAARALDRLNDLGFSFGFDDPPDHLTARQFTAALNGRYSQAQPDRLGYGTYGAAVEVVQQELIASGHLARGEGDGYWGIVTENAYRQALADGVVEPLVYHPGYARSAPSGASASEHPDLSLAPAAGFDPGLPPPRTVRSEASLQTLIDRDGFGDTASIEEAARFDASVLVERKGVDKAREVARAAVAGRKAPVDMGVSSRAQNLGLSVTWNLHNRGEHAVAAALYELRAKGFDLEAVGRDAAQDIRARIHDVSAARARVGVAEDLLQRAYAHQRETQWAVDRQEADPAVLTAARRTVGDARDALAQALRTERRAVAELQAHLPPRFQNLPITAAHVGLEDVSVADPIDVSPRQIAQMLLDAPAMQGAYARFQAQGVRVEDVIDSQKPMLDFTLNLSVGQSLQTAVDVVANIFLGRLGQGDLDNAEVDVARADADLMAAKNFELYQNAFQAAMSARAQDRDFAEQEASIVRGIHRIDESIRANRNRLPSLSKDQALMGLWAQRSQAQQDLIATRQQRAVARDRLLSLIAPAETPLGSVDAAPREDHMVADPNAQMVGFVPATSGLAAASEQFEPKPRPDAWTQFLDFLKGIVSGFGAFFDWPTETFHRPEKIKEAAQEVWRRLSDDQRRALGEVLGAVDFTMTLDRWASLSADDREALEAKEPHLFRDPKVDQDLSYIVDMARSLRTRASYTNSRFEALEDAADFLVGIRSAAREHPPRAQAAPLSPPSQAITDAVESPVDVAQPGASPLPDAKGVAQVPARAASAAEVEAAPSAEVGAASPAQVEVAPSVEVRATAAPTPVEHAQRRLRRLMVDYRAEHQYVLPKFGPPWVSLNLPWWNGVDQDDLVRDYGALTSAIDALSPIHAEQFIENLSEEQLGFLTLTSIQAPKFVSSSDATVIEDTDTPMFALARKVSSGRLAADLVRAWRQGETLATSTPDHLDATLALGEQFLRRRPDDIERTAFIEGLAPHMGSGFVEYEVAYAQHASTADPAAALVARALTGFDEAPTTLLAKLSTDLPAVLFAARSDGLTSRRAGPAPIPGGLGLRHHTPLAAPPEPFLRLLETVAAWDEPQSAALVRNALGRLPTTDEYQKRLPVEDLRSMLDRDRPASDVAQASIDALLEPSTSADRLASHASALRLSTAQLSSAQLDDQLTSLNRTQRERLLSVLAQQPGGDPLLAGILQKVTDTAVLREALGILAQTVSQQRFVEIGRALVDRSPPLANETVTSLVQDLATQLDVTLVVDPRAVLIAELLAALRDPTSMKRSIEALVDRGANGQIRSKSRLYAVTRAATMPQGRSDRDKTALLGLPGGGPATAANDVEPLVRLLGAVRDAGTSEHRAMMFHASAWAIHDGIGRHQKLPVGVLGLSVPVRRVANAAFELLAAGSTGDTVAALSRLDIDPSAQALNLLSTFGFGAAQWNELARLQQLSPDERLQAARMGAPFTHLHLARTDPLSRVVKTILDKLERGDARRLEPEAHFWFGDRGERNGPPQGASAREARERLAYFRGGMAGGLSVLLKSVRSNFPYDRNAESTAWRVIRESLSFTGLATDVVGGNSPRGKIAKQIGKVAEVIGKMWLHKHTGDMVTRSLRAEGAVRSGVTAARQSIRASWFYPYEETHATHRRQEVSTIVDFIGDSEDAAKFGEMYDGDGYFSSPAGHRLRHRLPAVMRTAAEP